MPLHVLSFMLLIIQKRQQHFGMLLTLFGFLFYCVFSVESSKRKNAPEPKFLRISLYGRNSGIRTHDLTHPKGARYQTALYLRFNRERNLCRIWVC